MDSRLAGVRIREVDQGKKEIRVASDAQDAALQSAALFAELAQQAIVENGRFTVLVSGGSTPIPLYQRLAQLDLPWDQIHVYWGDERMVAADDPESNFGNFKKALLDHISIPPENVHRVRTELGNPQDVAKAYEIEIRKSFRGRDWPRFDLAIQGMGPDGHTASLFPGSESEHDSPSWVIAPYVEKLGAFRISVSLGVLNSSKTVLFLVSGPEKAEMVRRVLHEPMEHQGLLPAQRVAPSDGRLIWILDPAAASRL